MNNIADLYQLYDKRIFIDISSNGCGSGCVYCFSKNPEKQQVLLDALTIDEICNHVLQIPNREDFIVSLCPNTEPMKSAKSRELISHIISKLINHVKFIQISTKELIPDSYLEQLNLLATRKGQIRISVSIPFLKYTEDIEPNAAAVSCRLQNFVNIKRYKNLISVLYLRPFNKQMLVDKESYLRIISLYHPDDICIGAEFVPKVQNNQQCTYMYDHRLKQSIFVRPDKEDIFSFANYLRKNANCKIFFSSVCNIANCSDYGCILSLFECDQRYCTDCTLLKPQRKGKRANETAEINETNS